MLILEYGNYKVTYCCIHHTLTIFRNPGICDDHRNVGQYFDGHDEQDAISPLGRPRTSNGDASFPLRKTGTLLFKKNRFDYCLIAAIVDARGALRLNALPLLHKGRPKPRCIR